MSREYPRQAWVLTSSFNPKEVTVVKPYRSYRDDEEWDVIETGKTYHKDNLFHSKLIAIQYGRAQVEKQKANIVRLETMLKKRIATLDKAEGSADPSIGASNHPTPNSADKRSGDGHE